MIDRIGDFFFNNMGWFILAFFVFAGIAAFGSASTAKLEKERFMEACLKDKKEYECVAMWRSGDSHTSMVPIPIVIPMGR